MGLVATGKPTRYEGIDRQRRAKRRTANADMDQAYGGTNPRAIGAGGTPE